MLLRFGFPFQPGGQFRERGVGLHHHLLLQQGEQLPVQRRWITAAVRQRRKTLTTTPELHHSGDRAAAYAKSIGDLVKSALASFIGQYQFLSQVG
jgi:hypothetical protein